MVIRIRVGVEFLLGLCRSDPFSGVGSRAHHCRDTAICSISAKTQKQKFGENKHAIGQRKSLRERMYIRQDEEAMYCSITKISIQSVIDIITNNFEALCTSLLRNYPWYTRRIWIEPLSAVTGISVGKYA